MPISNPKFSLVGGVGKKQVIKTWKWNIFSSSHMNVFQSHFNYFESIFKLNSESFTLGFNTITLSTTNNHAHSNPCVCNLCLNQQFCDYRCEYPLYHLVKTTCNHINKYKVVCNCICHLHLQLMSKDEKYTYIIHFYWHPK